MEPLIIDMFNELGYIIKTEQDLFALSIPVEKLKDPELIKRLYSTIPKVKSSKYYFRGLINYATKTVIIMLRSIIHCGCLLYCYIYCSIIFEKMFL